MTVWNARTTDELDLVAGPLGDAYFDIDELEHDEGAGVLTIPFAQEGGWGPLLEDPAWRDAPRAETVRVTWRFREERVPLMRGVLTVRNVEAVAIDDGAGDAGMLLNLSYDEGTRTLTVEGVSGNLKAVVESLDITSELRPDEVALYIRRRHSVFGWSSERRL